MFLCYMLWCFSAKKRNKKAEKHLKHRFGLFVGLFQLWVKIFYHRFLTKQTESTTFHSLYGWINYFTKIQKGFQWSSVQRTSTIKSSGVKLNILFRIATLSVLCRFLFSNFKVNLSLLLPSQLIFITASVSEMLLYQGLLLIHWCNEPVPSQLWALRPGRIVCQNKEY